MKKNDVHEKKLCPEWIGIELVRLTNEEGYSASFQAHTYDLRENPTKTDNLLSWMAGKECMKIALEEDFGKAVLFSLDGDFFKANRRHLGNVARKRFVKEYDYFDYENLRVRPGFLRDYKNLFKGSLKKLLEIEDLVYKNMLRHKS